VLRVRVLGRRSALLPFLGVLALLATFTVAVQLWAPAAHAANPAKPGFLAFTSNQNDELMSVDAGPSPPDPSPTDGPVISLRRVAYTSALAVGDTQRLTNSPGHDNQPSGRPDGSIVFVRTQQDLDGDLFVRAPDKAERRLLASPGRESDPAWSPDGSKVAFVSTRSGQTDIWVVGQDGTGLRQITRDAAVESSPTWSRDGGQLAFSSTREKPNGRIYRISSDGSGQQTRVANPSDIEGDIQPSWSPTSDEIAFTRTEVDGDTNIKVMNVDGGGSRTVASAPYTNEEQPAWSPDGKRIAYSVPEGHSPSGIWSVEPDGSGAVQLVGGKDREKSDPTWTSNSEVVATTTEFADNDIWGIRPDRTDQHDISRRPGTDRTARYSPDGRRIAYAQQHGQGGFSIVVAAADGTNPQVITNAAGTKGVLDTHPTWRPDGRALAFQRDADGPPHIFTVDVDGTGEQDISAAGGAPEGAGDKEPAWAPDGSRIAFASEEAEDHDILLMDPDGSNRKDLTGKDDIPDEEFPDFQDDHDPSWSPDSKSLVYARDPNLGSDAVLYTVVVSTGLSEEFLIGPGDGDGGRFGLGQPAWSPDGQEIAYVIERFRSDIAVVDVATKKVRTVVQTSEFVESEPSWQPVADLAISKDGPSQVDIRESATYTLAVVNRSKLDAPEVKVTDTLPEGLELTGTDPSQGTCKAGPPLECSLGTVKAGDQATVKVTAKATRAGLVVNRAQVESRLADPDPSDNSAITRTGVRGTEMSVTAVDDPDPVDVGKELTYRLTVTQKGPFVANDVLLTVPLPAGATLVSAKAEVPEGGEVPDGECKQEQAPAGPVLCRWKALFAGDGIPDVRNATVVIKPTRAGTAVSTVELTSATPEVDPADNTVRIETEVRGADLTVGLAVAPKLAFFGGRVAVHAVVSNLGGAPAANSKLELQLPRIACQAPVAGKCPATGTKVTLQLGQLAPGASVTRDLTLTATEAGKGPIRATASTDTVDTVPGNNTVAAQLEVRQPKIVMTPAVGPPGFVTLVRGTGFPPNTDVSLTWLRGITPNTAPTRVAANGTFTAQMVVIRRDLEGQRQLNAKGLGFADVRGDFLVVAGSVSPLGFLTRD
jgi:uncharacterized repeat protein (TIGR01451 family)